MASLVRARPSQPDCSEDLQRNIPTPFPTHRLIDLQDDPHLDHLATEPVEYDDIPLVPVARSQNSDIQTSVAAVQDSCLTTLANILSVPDQGRLSSHNHSDIALGESPLSFLVHSLRTRLGHPDRPDQSLSESSLLAQLLGLVETIVPSLDTQDAHLAQAILALLLDLQQLPDSLSPQFTSQSDPFRDPDSPAGTSPHATIATLQRRLSSLQLSVVPTSSGSRPSPVECVRTALLYARIDEQLETVASLCRARASSQHDAISSPSSQDWNKSCRPSFDDALPPEYDSEYHHYPYERPPSYAAEAHLYTSDDSPTEEKRLLDRYPPEKASPFPSASTDVELTARREHHDFERVTHAIERLYEAAPQLVNQRVELRRDKILQMERAKEAKGKARNDAPDPELDKMLDLLGRASAREIPDQSVVLDPRRGGREKGAADIEEQRRKYLEHLVHRSHAGRLHSQDAILPSSATHVVQDSEEDQSYRDDKRASFPSVPKTNSPLEPPSERSRTRSLSASNLSWLRSKDKSGNAAAATKEYSNLARSLSSDPRNANSIASRSVRSISGRLRGGSKTRPSSAGGEDVNHGVLDIAYVAEHHETLKHVLLFIAYASQNSAPVGIPLAEVLPGTSSGTHGDFLFLRLGSTPSPPLALPVPVLPGSKTVLGRGGHWEVKASCYQKSIPPRESEEVNLLPASELASLSPSSYACASCSLPLVPAPPARYRDLPSEHWEELIDAWMCHPEEQTLAKNGMHGPESNGNGSGFGFWPTRDEALVGGSYVLFDAESVATGNIKCVGGRERDGNTRLARCLCGAILGRQHDRRQGDGSVSRMYRLFKYAIRPISAASQVPKVPMSAFVLHDMLEHVQAHATYRFVLSDEEDEKPRLLIWLFKPRIRISYMLPVPTLLPKSGTIDGSKVLYKILGPTTSATDLKEILNKYPGFPQAEFLFYPMDVCRKLAALLKESTGSYPESMRTMTGLDVGWLTMS